MQNAQTNWNKFLEDPAVTNDIILFAVGSMSGRQMESRLRFTPVSGEFRKLVRSGGVNRARTLAKKALSRRGIISYQ